MQTDTKSQYNRTVTSLNSFTTKDDTFLFFFLDILLNEHIARASNYAEKYVANRWKNMIIDEWDRRSCRANTAIDKFASVKRCGRRRTTVSRHWEAIKTLNSHFRPGKKVVLEYQPKGEKIGVNGIRNASREYIKSAWITRKWTDRDGTEVCDGSI